MEQLLWTRSTTTFLPQLNTCLAPSHRTRARVTLRALTSPSSSTPPASDAGELVLLPNAHRRERAGGSTGGFGFSLGVDLGDARTGLAVGKGFSRPRPLTVLELRGQRLELRLLEIAEKEEADEFIVGLPVSSDGKETAQSNKVRSAVGRLAVRAAESAEA